MFIFLLNGSTILLGFHLSERLRNLNSLEKKFGKK